jgi:hypothetical protein
VADPAAELLPLSACEHTGHAKVNGISLFYATIGHGSPVVHEEMKVIVTLRYEIVERHADNRWPAK